MAIEIVNVEDNSTVLFDEFIAHRMGLLPLSSINVGDVPGDHGYQEHQNCDCVEGCGKCSVEFKLDVTNTEDKILNVTHFDLIPTGRFTMDDDGEPQKDLPNAPDQLVQPLPLPDAVLDRVTDEIDNGILIVKLKKDQRIAMTCTARKGIPKYHSKFMPVATTLYNFQQIVDLENEAIDSLDLEEKVAFVECCPRKVFGIDSNDRVRVERLRDCHYCDECVAKARELGKRNMVTVKMQQDMFHFKVESVTKDGPRKPAEVVRASLRIFDYKLQLFLKDAYNEKMDTFLPHDPKY
jgi:DNA-directed RNA polymerase II subunit RPB3